MQTNQKSKIIIVGGGYAGISLLHKLKNNPNLELVLIDRSQKHLLQTHLHKYLSGYYDEKDITFNHEKYCKANNIEFINDEVNLINYKESYLTTKQDGLHRFDYIVVATGSRSVFPRQIQNIIEFAKDIKDIENLSYYRAKFTKLLSSSPQGAKVVIVGGGLSGLQVACEMGYWIKKKNLTKEQMQVCLVEGLDTLLPGLDKVLIEKATKRCKELDIEVINSKFASKVTNESLELSDGTILRYDLLIFLIGLIGNDIANFYKLIKENKLNQIIVNDFYQITPFENAFAIGDIAQANDTATNKPQTPTAQAARMQAELVAKNILKSIKKEPLIQNNISNKGTMIDLGGPSRAIGKLFGINLDGIIAVWFKKLIYFMHAKKFN